MSNLMTDMKPVFPLCGSGVHCSKTLEPVLSVAVWQVRIDFMDNSLSRSHLIRLSLMQICKEICFQFFLKTFKNILMGCPRIVDLYIETHMMLHLKIIFWCVSNNTHGTYSSSTRWSQLATHYSVFSQITTKLESLGKGFRSHPGYCETK